MNRPTLLSIAGPTGVALIIGLAVGSIAFPATRTLTTTQPVSTATTTITQQPSTVTIATPEGTVTIITTGGVNELVTLTLETVQVYVVLPTCTTISGTPTVVYGYPGSGGETTTVTTIWPTSMVSLPSQFNATVVTASTGGVSNHTQYFTGSCG